MQDFAFQACANELYEIHQQCKFIKIPNYDILTAVDVLSTGMYKRMLISAKSEQHNLPVQVLDSYMRVRMFSEYMPNVLRRNMKITDGIATFTVASEFSVSLSVYEKVCHIKDISMLWKLAPGYEG